MLRLYFFLYKIEKFELNNSLPTKVCKLLAILTNSFAFEVHETVFPPEQIQENNRIQQQAYICCLYGNYLQHG